VEKKNKRRKMHSDVVDIGMSRQVRHSNFNPFAHTDNNVSSLSAASSPTPSFLNMTGDTSMTIDDENGASPEGVVKVINRMNRTLFLDDDDVARTPTKKCNISPVLACGTPSTPTTPTSNGQMSFCLPTGRLLGDKLRSLEPRDCTSSSRFDEEFEVLATLGSGHFGKVMKVKKRLDGCFYAVKMVNELIRGRNHRERVLKEVYALSALWENNEHILRYYSSWMEFGL
jgi:CCR4-NOT transcriptional regulation complex NOT5 subunit